MEPITIFIKYDPEQHLPPWARSNEAIVEVAKKDLAFRCAVWDAKTSSAKRLIEREAQRRMNR